MKKFLFSSFILASTLPASAQLLQITKVEQTNDEDNRNVSLYLSNGERIHRNDSCWCVDNIPTPCNIPKRISDRIFEKRWENIDGKMVYNCQEGDIIYKSRRGYRFVTPTWEKDVTIKSICIRSAKVECIFGADYAIRDFQDLCYPSDILEKTGCIKVADVTFDDDSSVTIITEGDPSWRSAKIGQKVKVYVLQGISCYKLIH